MYNYYDQYVVEELYNKAISHKQWETIVWIREAYNCTYDNASINIGKYGTLEQIKRYMSVSDYCKLFSCLSAMISTTIFSSYTSMISVTVLSYLFCKRFIPFKFIYKDYITRLVYQAAHENTDMKVRNWFGIPS